MTSRLSTAVVTGASGFLATYVIDDLRQRGLTVHGLTRGGPGALDVAAWEARIAELKPDLLVHCAGSALVARSLDDPATDFASGPVLTFRLLDALRRHASGCRFLFLSSAAVYGDPAALPIGEDQPVRPLSPYGFHKRQSELICEEFAILYGVPAASLRIFSAYGPGLTRQVVWDLYRRARASAELRLVGTGAESRDFIHARDVAQAVWQVATRGALAGESYNVAAGEEVRIADLADALLRHAGRDGATVSFDGQVAVGQPIRWHADISRLRALGFSPTIALEDGLRTVVDWAREVEA